MFNVDRMLRIRHRLLVTKVATFIGRLQSNLISYRKSGDAQRTALSTLFADRKNFLEEMEDVEVEFGDSVEDDYHQGHSHYYILV